MSSRRSRSGGTTSARRSAGSTGLRGSPSDAPAPEIAIGRRDDAHVDDASADAPNRWLNLAVLDQAQQHDLHPKVSSRRLRRAARCRPAPISSKPTVAMGIGEAAAHVAEELALEQRLGTPAQLMVTKGFWARLLRRWIGRARPLCRRRFRPVIRTFEFVAATASASSTISRSASLAPMNDRTGSTKHLCVIASTDCRDTFTAEVRKSQHVPDRSDIFLSKV